MGGSTGHTSGSKLTSVSSTFGEIEDQPGEYAELQTQNKAIEKANLKHTSSRTGFALT